METIIKRIRKIAKEAASGEGVFEDSIGVSRGYLNVSDKRDADPSAGLVLNIVRQYPEYSLEWIMTGSGTMKLQNRLVLNEPTKKYASASKTLDALVDQKIKTAIETEVQPKIELLNDSILRYMKQNIEPNASKKKLKKNS